ncbi:MAG: LTA synthase family protein [Gammaproteobacteria bacterium]
MTYLPRSLRLLFTLFVFHLLWLSLMRVAFWAYFQNPVDPVPGADLLQAFYLGLKYDTRLILLLLLPPLLLGWLPRLRLFDPRLGQWLWQGYFVVTFLVLLVFYLSDFGYYGYLDKRIDATILRFVANFGISLQMVWQSYSVVNWSLLLAAIGLGYAWLLRRVFAHYAQQPAIKLNRWRKTAIVSATGFVVLLGLYGKLSWYPLRWSDAFFSPHTFASAMTANPVLYFLDTLKNKEIKYDRDKVRAAYPQIAEYLGLQDRDSENLNFVREQRGNRLQARQPNIVLVYLESFAAYKTGIFGNPLNPTPVFDAMSKEGLLFTQFYTPHTGTARSVFAGITGLPDVELQKTSTRNPLIVNQYTLINTFEGYEKFYFIGGSASWGNIRGLLSHNIPGLQLYEEGSYASPRMDVWGISDLHLFAEANQVLKQQDKPFVAIIQTSGNHRPYNIPEDNRGFQSRQVDKEVLKISGFSSEDEFNSFSFMDHSIGYFMEQAKAAGYFDNTIFVFWGDHGISGYSGEHMAPYITQTELSGMHVPLLIYAPGLIPEARVYDKVASELDVLPTVAGLAAPSYINTTLGRDLLDPAFDAQRYAFTITHYSVPEIGLVGERFYFRMNADGSNKRLHDLSLADTRHDSSPEHPQLARQMQELCLNLYETAKYLRYHNAHSALQTSQQP